MSNAWIEEETAPYLLTPQVSTAEFLNEYTTRICSPAALWQILFYGNFILRISTLTIHLEKDDHFGCTANLVQPQPSECMSSSLTDACIRPLPGDLFMHLSSWIPSCQPLGVRNIAISKLYGILLLKGCLIGGIAEYFKISSRSTSLLDVQVVILSGIFQRLTSVISHVDIIWAKCVLIGVFVATLSYK